MGCGVVERHLEMAQPSKKHEELLKHENDDAVHLGRCLWQISKVFNSIYLKTSFKFPKCGRKASFEEEIMKNSPKYGKISIAVIETR